MKTRNVPVVVFATLTILLAACYPQGPDYIEELDIVITNYEDGYNFTAKQTYARPDAIVKITGDRREGDAPEFIPQPIADAILATIDANMTALGYTKVDIDSAEPDLVLMPASWETTTIMYYYDYWYWWYGGYYPFWPGYYPSYATSYTTGTLFLTLIDPDVTGANGNAIRQWTAAANGILTYSFSAARVNGAINQAFAQSPYLKTN